MRLRRWAGRIVSVVCVSVAVGVFGVASAGVTPVVISTLADENNEGFAFGDDATATIGQTIIAPQVSAPSGSGTVLTAFSFRLNVPAGLIFRGFVYGWDGTQATGPELFQSTPMSTSGSGSMETVTFTTPGIPVTAGETYVIFVSISLDAADDVGEGNGPYGLVIPGTYPDGNFVFLNNAGDASQWTTVPWNTNVFVPTLDTAFSATFDAPTTTPTTTAPAAVPVQGIPSFTG